MAARCGSTRSTRRGSAAGRPAREGAAGAASGELGLDRLEGYEPFGAAGRSKPSGALLEFLIECRRAGKRVAGYGAPGKGNTLLNYCGIRTDLLEFTVDRNPYKQGQFLPGTQIPIHHPEALEQARPDFILILPWNLSDEIVAQLSYVREWGAPLRAVPTLIPEVRVRVKVVIFCGGQGLRMREVSETRAQADGPDRRPAGPLARDEVLRALRPHRLHPLPGLQGRGDQASSSSPTTRRWPTTSSSPTAARTSTC